MNGATLASLVARSAGFLRDTLAIAAFTVAVVSAVVGVFGMFRYRDPYVKLQASSLAGTTAVFSVFVGALLLAPNFAIAARILVIMVFFLVSAPTGSHITARYIWKSGIEPRTARHRTLFAEPAPGGMGSTGERPAGTEGDGAGSREAPPGTGGGGPAQGREAPGDAFPPAEEREDWSDGT